MGKHRKEKNAMFKVVRSIILLMGMSALLLAIGCSGSDSVTSTKSLDTSSWTMRTSPAGKSTTFRAVSYGNNTYVAVAMGGIILTSPDGLHWTPRLSNTTVNLFSVEYLNSTFFALGAGGVLITSKDGIVWSNPISVGASASETLTSIAYGKDRYMITSGSGDFMTGNIIGGIYTSTDGANWTRERLDNKYWYGHVTFANEQFVIVGATIDKSPKGCIVTSPDGIQ